jgi:hypothetical protein
MLHDDAWNVLAIVAAAAPAGDSAAPVMSSGGRVLATSTSEAR